jgi:hypothetical protein
VIGGVRKNREDHRVKQQRERAALLVTAQYDRNFEASMSSVRGMRSAQSMSMSSVRGMRSAQSMPMGSAQSISAAPAYFEDFEGPPLALSELTVHYLKGDERKSITLRDQEPNTFEIRHV